MTINKLIQLKNVRKSEVSNKTGVPYSTLSDICSGKTKIQNCSAEVVYRLAQYFDVSMEDLLKPVFQKRISFELFKSNVCHRLKELGDIDFIIETLQEDKIREYYNRQWYRESLYLLAMLDYISRINNVELCTRYDDLRQCKLKSTVYPSSILAICAASKNNVAKRKAEKESIPEFKRFNIIESEVRNVV